MAVPAIGAGDDVVGIDGARDADRNGFLAVGKMRAAAHVTFGEQLLDALFDGADLDHPRRAARAGP